MGTWPYATRWRSRRLLSVLLVAGLVTPLLPAAAGSLGPEGADRALSAETSAAFDQPVRQAHTDDPGVDDPDVGILAEPVRTPPAEPEGPDVKACLDSEEAESSAGRVYNRFMWCRRGTIDAGRVVGGRVTARLTLDYSLVGYGRDDTKRSVVIFFRGDDVSYWPTPKGHIRPTSYLIQGITCPENTCDDAPSQEKRIRDWMGSWTRFEVGSDPAFGEGPDAVSHARWYFTGQIVDDDWGYQLPTNNMPANNIRCDSAQYFRGRQAACVFDDVIPRLQYSTNDPMIDEVSKHIKCAQNEPSCERGGSHHDTYPPVDNKSVPGKYVRGEATRGALHRIASTDPSYTANRNTTRSTCSSAPASVYDPAAGEQCDEYPFASTAEGAANTTWDFSVEGVSAADNRCAGTALQHYYRKDRILQSYRGGDGNLVHQDDFFVNVSDQEQVVSDDCEPLSGSPGGGCGTRSADTSADGYGILCVPRPPDDPPPPVVNQPPTVDAGPDRTTPEGTPVDLAGTVTDPDDDPRVTWSYGLGEQFDPGADCSLGSPGSVTSTFVCNDDGDAVVALTADDGHNAPVTDAAAVTVTNVAPTAQITSPTAGQMINAMQPAPVNVTFTDPGANDTHSCSVDFGDGTAPTPGTVSQSAGGGTCTAEHVYGFDGLGPRTITATITDDDGGTDSTPVGVVVYVPGAGFAIEATGLLEVDRTPDVRCPPDDAQSTAALNTLVGRVGALNVSCTVSTTTGRTEVETSVADVTLLNGLVRITDIQSTCTADAEGIERSSLVGTINGIPIGAGSGSLSVLGLVEVAYNESTTDAEGRLVQNAIRVRAAGQEVVVGNCRLG